jgi:two-component sensor histidine kinase
MAMIVHELATNAAKHGALSTPRGKVMIEWRVAGEQVCLRWQETDGPACVAPTRKGVGSTVIERAAALLDATATSQWTRGGLLFELSAPRAKIQA